jgi:exodeoxyribonuclease-5
MAAPAQAEVALSASQAAALEAVGRWLDAPCGRQVFRLHGYAGTGKSTLARRAAALAGEGALFGAYTGKAAQVLRSKGCPAKTIHSLLYVVVPRSPTRYKELKAELAEAEAAGATAVETRGLRRAVEEELEKLRKPRFEVNVSSPIRAAPLLVLDEVSMIGPRMVDDLVAVGTPILALGDPAQLPPVRASDGYFTSGKPDVLLTEVMRHGDGSPVLELATMARERRALPVGYDRGGSRVLRKGTLTVAQLVEEFDQVVCGTNWNRRALNRAMRKHLGRTSPFPEVGDRVICLRNDHDAGLMNGSQWLVRWVSADTTGVTMEIEPLDEGAECRSMAVVADPGYFTDPDHKGHPFSELNAFDFANAITTHRAQGSEWPRVLVVDESKIFREHAHRHLYTSITRARDQVTVVQ